MDQCSLNPGGQATFYDGHKITVLIWSDCLESLSKKNSKQQFLF